MEKVLWLILSFFCCKSNFYFPDFRFRSDFTKAFAAFIIRIQIVGDHPGPKTSGAAEAPAFSPGSGGFRHNELDAGKRHIPAAFSRLRRNLIGFHAQVMLSSLQIYLCQNDCCSYPFSWAYVPNHCFLNAT